MSDRHGTLRTLADTLSQCEGVADAWTAKSFTDLLVVVEVPPEADLPDAVRSRLRDHGLRGADEVYDTPGAEDAAFAGSLDDGRRYRFVDTESRGEHRSYVVE
ncbi:hypothetical protein [Haloarcula litorea]|uniref:hypothetical protein n=1 Tax=Haloarcula litorea TaxID=3032579 RepID=UPI0023E80E2A|nr:hypothetical protein [Halomicroarcula sp. GDY20]